MQFERCRAWRSEKLRELHDIRYNKGWRYDQLEKHFRRTNVDIVNALSTINMRKKGGLDPFEQIGSDEKIAEAERYEKAFARRHEKCKRGSEKMKEYYAKKKGVNECQ